VAAVLAIEIAQGIKQRMRSIRYPLLVNAARSGNPAAAADKQMPEKSHHYGIAFMLQGAFIRTDRLAVLL